MSIRSTMLAAAAALILGGGVATAGALPANAATPDCGPFCVDLFSQANGTFASPGSVIDDQSGDQIGAPLVTYPASGGYPGEDFTVISQEPVSNYWQGGVVSLSVAQHWGCRAGVTPGCVAGAVNDDAFELEYTPGGDSTLDCVGIASTAAQGTEVTLQQCGVNNHTLWILDSSQSLNKAYSVLIAASDTDFTAPYVLTDDGPVNGLPFEQQLETANLVTSPTGSAEASQLWGADTGALPVSALTMGTTSLPAATGGQAYSAALAAYGGATPYTWSVSSGSLPPGLTLDPSTGVISGTPDVTGTYDFTVTVSDAESPAMTASRVLSIAVSGPVVTAVTLELGVPTYALITGTGLACPSGEPSCRVSVSFGNHQALVVFVRPTEIVVLLPAGSGTVNVTVTVGGVSSQASKFTYRGSPF